MAVEVPYLLYLTDAATVTAIQDLYPSGIPLPPATAATTYHAPIGGQSPGDALVAPGITFPWTGINPTPEEFALQPFTHTNADGSTTDCVWVGYALFQAPAGGGGGGSPSDPIPPPTGSFQSEVVSWVGDGANGRLVPTSFPLDSGVVAVWISGSVGNVQGYGCFRHTDPGMLGTTVLGSSTIATTNGIMAFTAAGFTVTPGFIVGVPYANGFGRQYTAWVLRDTTSDNRYLRVGTYTGLGNFSTALGVTANSRAVTGGGFSPDWSGLPCSDASGSYVFFYTSPTSGKLTPSYQGATGATNMAFTGGTNRVITTVQTRIPRQVTHVWIFPGLVIYRPLELVGDQTTYLTFTNVALTGHILALQPDGFKVGSTIHVNTVGHLYHYLVLCTDAWLLAAKTFMSFRIDGAVPPLTQAIGFRAGYLVTRQVTAALSGGIWRGQDHPGTQSSFIDAGVTQHIAATGISAIGADSADLSSTAAPNGSTVVGYAALGLASTISVPPDPPIAPPLPASCAAPKPVATTQILCADATPVFP